MKKTALFLLVVLVTGFYSCKKCTTCQITNHNTFTSYPEEYCGTESEVNNFEKDYEKKALELQTISPDYIGVVAECHRKN
jgi:hypothetical protein